MTTFHMFQSAFGNADIGPVAREIALNNLSPVRADAIISLLWTTYQFCPEPNAATTPCQMHLFPWNQIEMRDTALLILPSGSFQHTNMFDTWKYDFVYLNKVYNIKIEQRSLRLNFK